MTKIVIAGDAHGRWDTLLRTVDKLNGEILIQLGDTGFYPNTQKADIKSKRHNLFEQEYMHYLTGEKTLPIPTYIIKGNHEDFDFLASLQDQHQIPNLTYIPNGQVFEVNKIKFGVIGGNHSPSYISKRKLHGARRRHFLQSNLDTLAKKHFDVLLTHDGPTNPTLRGGCEPLREFILETSPPICYHGHLHHDYETTIKKTKVIGLAKVGNKQRYALVHNEA